MAQPTPTQPLQEEFTATPTAVTPKPATTTNESNALIARFPPRHEVVLLFCAAVIPIFLWALLTYLDAVPGYALRFSLWDIVAAAGYTLVFALIESVIITLPFVLLAGILPARWFRNHFVAMGAALILISAFWMMYANYHKVDFSDWDAQQWVTVLPFYFLSLALALGLILRFERVEEVINTIVTRLSVLAYVYVALALVGIVVLVIRNL